MNLLLLFEDDRTSDKDFAVSGPRAVHLRSVLKVQLGQEIRVGLLDTSFGTAEVIALEDKQVHLRARWDRGILERPKINILLAMPRPKTLKKVLLEASAWGVNRITITETKRVEKAFFGATLLKPDNYRPVVHEGMMQGRHILEPRVEVQRSLRKWLDETDLSRHRCLALHPEVMTDLAGLSVADESLWVAIGPEGGFIAPEIDRLKEAGFEVAHIGSSILRVETAVVSALSQLDLLRRQSSQSR